MITNLFLKTSETFFLHLPTLLSKQCQISERVFIKRDVIAMTVCTDVQKKFLLNNLCVLTPHQHEGDSEYFFSLCVGRDISESHRGQTSDGEIDRCYIAGLKGSNPSPSQKLAKLFHGLHLQNHLQKGVIEKHCFLETSHRAKTNIPWLKIYYFHTKLSGIHTKAFSAAYHHFGAFVVTLTKNHRIIDDFDLMLLSSLPFCTQFSFFCCTAQRKFVL